MKRLRLRRAGRPPRYVVDPAQPCRDFGRAYIGWVLNAHSGPCIVALALVIVTLWAWDDPRGWYPVGALALVWVYSEWLRHAGRRAKAEHRRARHGGAPLSREDRGL